MVDLPESPSDVLHLLRDQARLYGELESCASRQHALVASARVEPLLSILSDRQQVSDSLVKIGNRLAPIRARWDSYRERFSSSERSEADQLLSESSTRLRNIMKGDERDARVLYGRKQAVASALRTVDSTNQAMSAYRGAVEPRSSGSVNEQS